jgi:iron complex outermembrane receptor protein
LEQGPDGPYVLIPVVRLAEGSAESWGLELSARWAVSEAWRLEGAYSVLDLDVASGNEAGDGPGLGDGRSPRTQAQLRSLLSLGSGVEVDGWIRHSSAIEFEDTTIPAYTGLDLRLGWSPRPGVRLDLGGKDLLEGPHLEFPPGNGYNLGSFVDRSWYGKVTWTF